MGREALRRDVVLVDSPRALAPGEELNPHVPFGHRNLHPWKRFHLVPSRSVSGTNRGSMFCLGTFVPARSGSLVATLWPRIEERPQGSGSTRGASDPICERPREVVRRLPASARGPLLCCQATPSFGFSASTRGEQSSPRNRLRAIAVSTGTTPTVPPPRSGQPQRTRPIPKSRHHDLTLRCKLPRRSSPDQHDERREDVLAWHFR